MPDASLQWLIHTFLCVSQTSRASDFPQKSCALNMRFSTSAPTSSIETQRVLRWTCRSSNLHTRTHSYVGGQQPKPKSNANLFFKLSRHRQGLPAEELINADESCVQSSSKLSCLCQHLLLRLKVEFVSRVTIIVSSICCLSAVLKLKKGFIMVNCHVLRFTL